jgi:hypothetical protein
MRVIRAQLPRILAAALLVMVMASGNDAWAAPPSGSEVRHSSGIVLPGPFDYGGISAKWHMSEKLRRAYHGARTLADHNQSAFGYPWQESDADIVVRVANPEGEALARRWMSGGYQQSVPKAGERVVLEIAPPEVRVRVEAVDRTIEQLQRIQHAVGPGLSDIPGTNRIFQSGPDDEYNRVVFTIDRVNDAMLRALAARFGTEAVAVRIERNTWNSVQDSPLVEEPSPKGLVVGAAVGASVALLVGVVLLALRPRRVPS